ncbi:hypothetical protein KI387_039559 [Taxus chinensis]|uniref:Magnesium transporter n=1 Tax=Taxus chinensis TaxID=29808 RepID=A0AA38C6R7_TAXCH|nr:hypothetical protein KI387_039559 [Taxus chinensis]
MRSRSSLYKAVVNGGGEDAEDGPRVGGGVGVKKKGVGVRAWLLLDASGQAQVVEAGKHAIMRRTGLPARDLRILDPLLSYPSTILGRERAIVINLEHIKAIITAQEVLFLNSRDPAVAPFVADLQRRLPHASNISAQQEGGNSDMDADLSKSEMNPLLSMRANNGELSQLVVENSVLERLNTDSLQNGSKLEMNAFENGPKVLPFEFRALEACLEAACSCLESERAVKGQRKGKNFRVGGVPPSPSLSISISSPSAASAADSAANDPAVARQQSQDKKYLLWKCVTKKGGSRAKVVGERNVVWTSLEMLRKWLGYGWAGPHTSADVPGPAQPYLGRIWACIRAVPIPGTFRTCTWCPRDAVLTGVLEQEAFPALDELTSKISTLNLERVRQIKSRLVAISGRVQKVRDELEHLLDDDEDMVEMYLTDKLMQQHLDGTSPSSFHLARGGMEHELTHSDADEESGFEAPSSTLNTVGRDEDSVTSSSTHSGTKGLDVEELEMLLEAYFVQIDGTLNKLSALREYVDDTEDYINIMLDDKQNHLLQMGVMLTTATLVISAAVVVAGLFGMNITIELFQPELAGLPQFLWTVGGCTTGEADFEEEDESDGDELHENADNEMNIPIGRYLENEWNIPIATYKERKKKGTLVMTIYLSHVTNEELVEIQEDENE